MRSGIMVLALALSLGAVNSDIIDGGQGRIRISEKEALTGREIQDRTYGTERLLQEEPCERCQRPARERKELERRIERRWRKAK